MNATTYREILLQPATQLQIVYILKLIFPALKLNIENWAYLHLIFMETYHECVIRLQIKYNLQ